MSAKICLSIYNERIAPVFDVAGWVWVVEIEGGQVYQESRVELPNDSAEHKVLQLTELGVDTLICGAISKLALHRAQSSGIQVYGFISGEAKEVLQAFLQNRLQCKRFCMPGCWRQRRCQRGFNRQPRGGFNRIRPGWAE